MSLAVRPAAPADADLIVGFIRALADYEKLLHEMQATRADIDPEMAKARQAAIGGEDEPPPHKRTDSAAAFGIDAAELG